MSNAPVPVSRERLVEVLRRASRLADRESAKSVLGYLNHVVIDAKPEPRPFRELARPWQWALARRLAPAVEAVAGVRKDYTGPRSFWLTLPKGMDKTGLLARLSNWAMAYARLRLNCYAAAKDRDQAAILADAMESEAALNPFLGPRLHFQNYRVTGVYKSTMRVLAADAAGASGLRPDLVVADEVTFWPDGPGQDMFNQLYVGREKRPNCCFVVISNAGVLGSWQHEFLESIQKEKSWFVYELPPYTRLPTWMSEERLDELRRIVPRPVAMRLLDNVWIPSGDNFEYLTSAEVRACEELGKSMNLVYQTQGRDDGSYVAAIDYGPKKDRTCMAVLHLQNEVAVVDRMDVMEGKKQPGGVVRIEAVESWIDEVRRKFPLSCLVIDPYQMEATCQKYESLIPIVRFEARGGKLNYALAETIRTSALGGRLAWYPDCAPVSVRGQKHTLTDEFITDVVVKMTSYGYRIMNRPSGHDDRVTTLGMGLVHLLNTKPKRPLYLSDSFF